MLDLNIALIMGHLIAKFMLLMVLASTTGSKILAENIHSGKIKVYNQKAVDKSQSLITVTPTQAVSNTINTKPIYIPITLTPFPTPPTKCTERMCPMIACIDNNVRTERNLMPPIDDCCPPCYPPPVDLEVK